MGAFRCPNCKATVTAESPVGLVCPSCGFGGAAGAAPAAGSPAAAAAPASVPAPGAPGTQYQAPSPLPTAGVMHGNGPMCPRCYSTYTQRGGIPTWAIVCTVVGFFVVCVLSLLFLIAKEDNQCYNCGLRWR